MAEDTLTTTDEQEATERHESREIALPSSSLGSPAAQMLDVIRRASIDPRCDVQKMEALLRMQRELLSDQARAEFNQDFAEMQPKLPRIPKRGLVSHGTGKAKFPYGKWEDIDWRVRPLLNEHGFSLSFTTEPSPQGGIIVSGTLRHRSGHEKTAQIGPLPMDNSGGKNAVQAAGSTFAYGKRYTATMLLNLTFEGADTDGEETPDDFIDAERVSEISRLLEETDSNVERFLKFFGIDQVSDMKRSQYQDAFGMLKSKRQSKQESHDAQNS